MQIVHVIVKLVKLAKSTDLWCLSPYVSLSQEAKDKQKQRKVCLVNLRGEVCTADNCGSKHPEVCLVADHGQGHVHIVAHAGPVCDSQGQVAGKLQREQQQQQQLIKLEAEYRAEELKARIRATKMM
jgi:hypothetical protein